MKEKPSIGIVLFLIIVFCVINTAMGDPVEMSPDGDIIENTPTPEELATKYIRSTKTQKRVKVVGVPTPNGVQIIHTGSLGDIVEVQDLPAHAECNVLIVGPEKEVGEAGEKKRKVPVVSDEELNKLWGKKGNSWPVKLRGVKHPLPEFYWNILLKGKACELAADEPDYYLASDWKQLMALPDNIKKSVIKVSVTVEEEGKDVRKEFFWGDPEIDSAKEILFASFGHGWAGRSDINFESPELIEHRKNNK